MASGLRVGAVETANTLRHFRVEEMVLRKEGDVEPTLSHNSRPN